MEDQGADGDLGHEAQVAQRPHECHVRPAGAVGILPMAGIPVAARSQRSARIGVTPWNRVLAAFGEGTSGMWTQPAAALGFRTAAGGHLPKMSETHKTGRIALLVV